MLGLQSWSRYFSHASAITEAAKIQPIEFQNQRVAQVRSLAFLLVDGIPHPVSLSMIFQNFSKYKVI